jgi:hypothetical protein
MEQCFVTTSPAVLLSGMKSDYTLPSCQPAKVVAPQCLKRPSSEHPTHFLSFNTTFQAPRYAAVADYKLSAKTGERSTKSSLSRIMSMWSLWAWSIVPRLDSRGTASLSRAQCYRNCCLSFFQGWVGRSRGFVPTPQHVSSRACLPVCRGPAFRTVFFSDSVPPELRLSNLPGTLFLFFLLCETCLLPHLTPLTRHLHFRPVSAPTSGSCWSLLDWQGHHQVFEQIFRASSVHQRRWASNPTSCCQRQSSLQTTRSHQTRVRVLTRHTKSTRTAAHHGPPGQLPVSQTRT